LYKKIKADKSVVFTDLDDGSGVLLHLESKFYYSLNLTGSFIWRLLEEKGELEENNICEAVTDNFDINKEEAEQDVKEFLGELQKEGIIQVQ
jgi:hypothetical protein